MHFGNKAIEEFGLDIDCFCEPFAQAECNNPAEAVSISMSWTSDADLQVLHLYVDAIFKFHLRRLPEVVTQCARKLGQ